MPKLRYSVVYFSPRRPRRSTRNRRIPVNCCQFYFTFKKSCRESGNVFFFRIKYRRRQYQRLLSEQIRAFLLTEYVFSDGKNKKKMGGKKIHLGKTNSFYRYTQDQKLIIILTAKAHKSNNILRYYKL